MKKILFAIFLMIGCVRAYGQCYDLDTSNYHIVFQEDFNYPSAFGLSGNNPSFSSAVATSGTVSGQTFSYTWGFDVQDKEEGDSGRSWTKHISDNVSLYAPGILRITEHQLASPYTDPATGHYICHTSGYIGNNHPVGGYGIFEARVHLPATDIAPYHEANASFWTGASGGLYQTELDMFDGSAEDYYHSATWDWSIVHHSWAGSYNGGYIDQMVTPSRPIVTDCGNITNLNGWHVFSCQWTPLSTRYYIDGVFVFELDYTTVRTYPGLMGTEFWVMTWFGLRSDATRDGFYMDVDWMKVYEQNCTSGDLDVNPYHAPTIIPGLYKSEFIPISTGVTPLQVDRMSGTVFEAEATTINSTFLADESTFTTHVVSPPGDTARNRLSNGFLLILPIKCGVDDNAWYRNANTSGTNTNSNNQQNTQNFNSLSSKTVSDKSGGIDTSTNTLLSYNSSQVQIYPNPAQNTINIAYPCTSSGQMSLVIQDVNGRTVYKETTDCNEGGFVQQSIDISSFVQGVYTVNLTMNDQHVIKKIVKL